MISKRERKKKIRLDRKNKIAKGQRCAKRVEEFYAVVNIRGREDGKKILTEGTPKIYHCGDDSGEEPPVLIPNTEVKLVCADNTLLETTREDR